MSEWAFGMGLVLAQCCYFSTLRFTDGGKGLEEWWGRERADWYEGSVGLARLRGVVWP